MRAIWRTVSDWEVSHGHTFETVFFSRPDIYFQSSFLGAVCAPTWCVAP